MRTHRRPAWAFGLLFALGTACFAEPAEPATPTVSKETTYFTAPLRADGTVDYAEALNERLGKGVRREENAAIPLLEAAALGRAQKSEHYDKVRAKLGVSRVAPPTDPAPDDPADAFAGAEPPKLDAALRSPWTADQMPAVAAWLKSIEPRLKLMVDASRRRQFYMPLVRERDSDSMILILLPHLQEQRTLTRALVVRAMLALGNEDGEAFRRDAVAVVRIGRLTTRASTLLERLVAFQSEMAGLHAIQAAASGGFLSPEQVGRIVGDLRAAPAGGPVHETFDLAERACLLEMLQSCAAKGPGDTVRLAREMNVKLPPVAPAAGPADWDAAMRRANAWYDRMREAGRQPTFARRQAAVGVVQADLAATAAAAGKKDNEPVSAGEFADRVMNAVMSSLGQGDVAETRLAVDRTLTDAALALSLFRAKTGEYPASLRELVPAYLNAEAIDGFTGRPIVYRAEAGGYVLQSLGANGRDDTGAVGARNDDRVVRAER